ncbi:MAG: DMT family transporter [Myxococcales bacterium]|nr:DMT family transporter [Myxococcales bacterium]
MSTAALTNATPEGEGAPARSAPPATVVLLVGVMALAFAAVFFRLAAPTPPLVAAGLRLTLAAALMLPFAWRGLRAMDRATWRAASVGGLCYAIHFGAWVSSLTLTSVAASVTLVTATPVLLAIVALVTGRDRPSARQLLAIGVAFVGTLLLGGGDLATEGALLGDALALVGAGGMVGYLLVVRSRGAHLPVLAFATLACGTGGLLLLGAALALGQSLVPPSAEAAGYLVLATLVPQLVGHNAITWALRHLRPTTVGLATVAEPVGATLLAWWWLAEVPSALTLGGAVVILCAVALALAPPGSRATT